MIDNIRIHIKNFRGNFDKCEKQWESTKTECYKLYNHEGKEKGVFMLLEYNIKNNSLIIENSIRKWYNGGFTLVDLKKKSAMKTFEKIADALNISVLDLHEATFTKCELGLNLMVKVPIEQLEPMIVKYSTYQRFCYEGETVGFLGQDRKLIFYNKYKELIDKNDKNKKYDKEIKKKVFDAFNKSNCYFLRAEVRMEDRQAFRNSKLGHINNIGDLLDCYQDLYYLWTKEMSKVILLNKLVMSKSMNSREYMIARVLEAEGYSSFKINCLEKSVANTKSILSKDAESVIRNYGSKKEYNTQKFKADIYRNLKNIKGKGENLDMKTITKILFGKLEDISYNKK